MGTFENCKGLTSITIPESVISIGRGAFGYCTGLTSVTIGTGVTKIEERAFCGCKKLEKVKCLAENVPTTYSDAFQNTYVENATLIVPASALNAYRATEPWSSFGTIKAFEGDVVETKKCATPTITFANGKLTFCCDTEGVEYESEIKSSDINKFYTDEISLTACYDITVTAMKTGYDKSDVATAKLYWMKSSGSIEDVTSLSASNLRCVAMQSNAGFITLSGLGAGETVVFYSVDGRLLGTAKAIDGTAQFAAQSGSVVVAKIGLESLKIAVK